MISNEMPYTINKNILAELKREFGNEKSTNIAKTRKAAK